MRSKFKRTAPTKPSFTQAGLKGYTFPTETDGIQISVENVTRGHDRYATELKTTTIYYVVNGEGTFRVDDEFTVAVGDLVEILPGTEFVFAGKMQLILIHLPGFKKEFNVVGRPNDLYDKEGRR